MPEVSTILLAVLVVMLGALGFWFKRVFDQNDGAHHALAEKINEELVKQSADDRDLEEKFGRLMDAIAAERKARHASHKTIDDRVWELREHLAE